MWRSENMNVDIKRSCYVCSTACEFYLSLSRLFDGIFVPKVWKNIHEKLAGEARAVSAINWGQWNFYFVSKGVGKI